MQDSNSPNRVRIPAQVCTQHSFGPTWTWLSLNMFFPTFLNEADHMAQRNILFPQPFRQASMWNSMTSNHTWARRAPVAGPSVLTRSHLLSATSHTGTPVLAPPLGLQVLLQPGRQEALREKRSCSRAHLPAAGRDQAWSQRGDRSAASLHLQATSAQKLA